MKRILLALLTAIFLCGTTFGQARFKERTENWLQKTAWSNGDASLRSGNENGGQGGNRTDGESPTGEVDFGVPAGDAVYWMLLVTGAYAFFSGRRKMRNAECRM